jgi:hypothetical protein
LYNFCAIVKNKWQLQTGHANQEDNLLAEANAMPNARNIIYWQNTKIAK